MGKKERLRAIYSLSKIMGLDRKAVGSHWLALSTLQARKLMGGGTSLWSTIVAARRGEKDSPEVERRFYEASRVIVVRPWLGGRRRRRRRWPVDGFTRDDWGKGAVLAVSFWPSKLPKMPPRASDTDIEVFSLFRILCLFQRVITSQPVDRKSVV